jgi:hypothetical protein
VFPTTLVSQIALRIALQLSEGGDSDSSSRAGFRVLLRKWLPTKLETEGQTRATDVTRHPPPAAKSSHSLLVPFVLRRAIDGRIQIFVRHRPRHLACS